ncbi:MAG: cobalamin-dependent protein [Anaerolineae bacterium]
MKEFTQWRGFDLTVRRAKMERALGRLEVTSPDDIPLMINSPGFFAFGSQRVPEDYFTNPASMVDYQARGYEEHLRRVNDDYIPYFMPWFGTGVLASAFGCEIVTEPGQGNDPAVAGPCLHQVSDIARLRLPDPTRDGWMPRVLAAIDYARDNSDLPPGLTDMQGPLDTAGLMCGQSNLYEWMYTEPKAIHDLFDIITEAFIQWAKVQKQHIGEPLNQSNGLQGVWGPKGMGIWESDDDMVLMDPGLYREFVVPCVSRILDAFGGGGVHFCGNGVHHIENLKQIRHLRVVNTSPMGNFKAFAALKRELGDRVAFEIQDSLPRDVETYYPGLFAEIDDLRGIIMATLVLDTMAMDKDGGYEPVEWDPLEAAHRMVVTVRECARKKLAGEPLVTEPGAPVFAVAMALQSEPAEAAKPDLPPAQGDALANVVAALVALDREGLRAAVRSGLEAGLPPLQIVTLGMAEGMAQVGNLYEQGEYFLPQLLMAGATMQEGLKILNPLLKAQGGDASTKGTVVFGTVQGDMHDIGKNIVKTLLEASGFTVHDIGVNQPASAFVAKVRETKADIVAMSALLTTTMTKMADVVAELREAGMRDRVRVMVGGAPISREFADHIGAEGFAPDAVKAVREAERLMVGLRS